MQNTPISRRTLLKALLAGGGSVAALSFLPERWLKPVVRTGVIPAHAASSICGTYNLLAFYTPSDNRELILVVTTLASMDGQQIVWKFSGLPSFSDGVTFVGDAPDQEGTSTVANLGAPYGYGFGVLSIPGESGPTAPYISGTPDTMTAQISFTTPDNNTCTQTFSGVMVGLADF